MGTFGHTWGYLVRNGSLLSLPVFSSPNTFSAAENQTGVGTAVASPVDSYSIVAGGDGASFNIVAETGVITFKSAPDYETKNSYTLTVRATYGSGYTDQNITVAVTDVAEVDADAQAFITAAGLTDATQISAVDTLVKDLKGYSLWTKMQAIYPFVGGSATTHKYNLKDPRDLDAAFRLTFYGSLTHNSNGITGSTNGYADTHYNTSVNAKLNDHGFSYYSRTDGAANYTDMGN